jgi:hypothetical protein
MLGVLAYLAWRVVALEFRLGTRIGIRSILVLALPLLAGGYLSAVHPALRQRIGALPAAVRFMAALAAGALTMAAIRQFSQLYPLPAAELAVASCFAVIAFGSGASRARGRSLAPWGIAAGMLGYVALLGIPRAVLG